MEVISDCCKAKAIRHTKSRGEGGDGQIHYTCSKCGEKCEFHIGTKHIKPKSGENMCHGFGQE